MITIRKPPDVEVPEARTPGQFIGSEIGADLSQAAVERGRSIRRLAFPILNVAEWIAQIQDAGEEAQIEGFVEAERKDMRTYMDTHGDHATYEAKWGEADARIKKAIEGVTRKRTQDRLTNWYKRNSPVWEASVTQRIQDGVVIKTKADTLTAIDEIINADLRDDAITVTGEARRRAIKKGMSEDQAQNIIITESEVKQRRAEEIIDKANVNGSVWNEEELRILRNQIAQKIGIANKVRIEQEHQRLLEQFAETGRGMELEDATKFFNEISREVVTESERNGLIAQRKTQENIELEKQKVVQQQTSIQMLTDIWDGKLTDPQIVTDALRANNLDETDAKYLRDSIMNPELPDTTNEALIAMRYTIDGIAVGTETRETALKKVIEYTQQLNPTDGKAFIKEIFGEHDTKNAFWKREAWDYIEKQIMEVATLTGILYGSSEQIALSAKAHIAFEKALQDAAKDKKPIDGSDLLIKAHEIMLPFRKQAKPLVGGEKLPEAIGPPKPKPKPAPIKPGPPKGFDEFFKSIPEPLKPLWEKLSGDERLMTYRLLSAGVTGEQIAGMTPEERKTVSKLLESGYSIEKIKEVFNE